nr:serine/threonine-protein kinase [Paludisphaera mucosa]
MEALGCVASAHYRANGCDLARSLAAWRISTVRDDEAAGGVPGDSLATTLPGEPPTPSRTSPAVPREALAARYELLNVHARGGIGRVWKALDRQLQREVALKELQPRNADREDLRARFLLEAEITGKLEHPGIVPVYSLGEDEAGRPYYAMRFVQGDSLSVAIRDFHEARKKAEAAGGDPAQAWGVEFRQLLRRFLGACETLEYAHSKGYIHRDLKPGNIMVGPYGETLVVDWGLAKDVGSGPEPPAGPATAPEGEERPSPSGTSPGDQLGTPQYMSPEQAMGDLDRIGFPSDVYSLGATLHELLTGESPFHGVDRHAVVVAVLRGPAAPRSIVPTIPPALEAICLKATAFEPADRYPSAGALARDVENWLADEPVSAYPDGVRGRLARWVRRHRTLAYAAAAVLVGVSLAATTAAFSIDRAWRSERAARGEAEENFNLAQQAVEDYLTRISQDKLLLIEDSVDMRRLRKDLLQSALQYYEKFVAERRDDPKLRRRLAKAHHNLGVIQTDIAAPQDAVVALEIALQIWDALLESTPADVGLALDRTRTLQRLGKIRKLQDRPAEALGAYYRAIAALEALIARPGTPPARALELADCLSDVAAIQAKQGQVELSLRASTRARRILDELLAADPDRPSYRAALAEVANNQGFAASRKGDHAAAMEAFAECGEICRKLLQQVPEGEPRPTRVVELAGVSAANTGDILSTLGRYAEAKDHYEQSRPPREGLAAAHPTVTRHRLHLGLTYRGLGYAQHYGGDDAAALQSLGRARVAFEELIELDSDVPEAHDYLGWTLNVIGSILDEHGDHREAIPAFERAIAEHRLATAGATDVLEYRFHLASSLFNLAEQHADLGDVDAALPAAEEAARGSLDVLRAASAGPTHFATCLALASTCGEWRLQAGDPAGASSRLDEFAAAIRETPAAPSPSARDAALDAIRARQAACLIAAKRPAEARTILKDVEARLRERNRTAAGETPDAEARGALSEVLWLRSHVARLRGLDEEAAEADSGRIGLWGPRDAEGLVELAARAARRACLVGYGRTPLAAAGEAARSLDVATAEDDVRLALALGYADRARIRGDRELMTTLDRPATRDLRDDVGFPDPPFAPAP